MVNQIKRVMKELSIEEKAKAYDEAIAHAKILLKTIGNATLGNLVLKNEFKNMFPELAESKDERIREWLICTLKSLNNSPVQIDGAYEMMLPAIDWLEKQGEQKPTQEIEPTPIFKIGDILKRKGKDYTFRVDRIQGGYYHCDRNHGAFFPIEEQGNWELVEQKPADNVIEEEKPLLERFKQAVYDCAWGKVTCKKEGETKEEYANRWAEHFLLMVRDWADDYIDFTIQQKLRNSYEKGKADIIEQKPAWSEEDEEMFDAVIANIQFTQKTHNHEVNQIVYEREIDWLKSLKDRTQPKQEWSEEDDFMVENVRNSFGLHCGQMTNTLKEQYDKFFNKVKSLRPQNTWKPSDEQMYNLSEAAHYNSAFFSTDVLIGLYDDLKKLREE